MVHVPLMFLSEWQEFPSAPCLAGKKKNLMTARISMLLKSRMSPDMLPFSLCNKKRLAIRHMNRPLFPMTLLTPSYDIRKQVGLRTYQHPHIHLTLLALKDKIFSYLHLFLFTAMLRGMSHIFPQETKHVPFIKQISTSQN